MQLRAQVGGWRALLLATRRPLPRASHALTPTHCPLWPPVSSPILITVGIITTIGITIVTIITTAYYHLMIYMMPMISSGRC